MRRTKKQASSASSGEENEGSSSEAEDEKVKRKIGEGSIIMTQEQSVEFMLVTPDEKLYTCEGDGCVRIYDLDV